jgi:hypothetical protein
MPELNQYVFKCVENGSYETLVVNNNYGYIQVCIYTILFTSIIQIEIGVNISCIVVTNMTKTHSTVKCNFETHNDALPSPLLGPNWVQVNQIVELFGTQGTLSALSTKKG